MNGKYFLMIIFCAILTSFLVLKGNGEAMQEEKKVTGLIEGFEKLPGTSEVFMDWSWEKIEPYYKKLLESPLNEGNKDAWLASWTKIHNLMNERWTVLSLATSRDTADENAKKKYENFVAEYSPKIETWQKRLTDKLVKNGVRPAGTELPIRRIESKMSTFNEANLDLMVQVDKLRNEFYGIEGKRTVTWEGKEVTVTSLESVYQEDNRARREKAWRLTHKRWLEDREQINGLWIKFYNLRIQIAKNAGFDDYRDYNWKRWAKFSFSKDEAAKFRQAILEKVVPAATRVYEKRRKRLGLEKLRPWDLDVDPFGLDPLKPFETEEEFIRKTGKLMTLIDPVFGAYFDDMKKNGYLDLMNRKNKEQGGFCTSFDVQKKPFIFMNAVGTNRDLFVLLHEAGHATHNYESSKLPYLYMDSTTADFGELGAMAMEQLALNYLSQGDEPFYSEQDAARATIQQLEWSLTFWPYMAVVDGFQHWAYENPEKAVDPKQCDLAWTKLTKQFMPGIDWAGLEDELATGWHRKHHIHSYPLYYVEYGIANLGALQIWRNYLKDPKKATADYRAALALGGTVSVRELFKTAGAEYSLDRKILGELVTLIEETLEEKEKEIPAK